MARDLPGIDRYFCQHELKKSAVEGKAVCEYQVSTEERESVNELKAEIAAGTAKTYSSVREMLVEIDEGLRELEEERDLISGTAKEVFAAIRNKL